MLNVQGFSGAIEVKDSTFDGNIAYIQEVLLHESLESDTYYDLDN